MGQVLVTGGTGFLGSAVVRALLAKGERVVCLARAGSDRRNLDGLAIEVREGDLLDRASLASALEGCDGLFHVAAAYHLWVRDPATLYRANVDGTAAIMEAALDRNVERVVYTSSVAVLAVPKGTVPLDAAPPADESAEPSGVEAVLGHYKRSKYLAERKVRELCATRGLKCVIAMPSTPIGPRDLKPTPTGQIVVDFLNGKMVGYIDTGLNVIDVDDCAAGHLLALERGTPGERYILGGQNLTLRRILDLLAERTGLPGPRFRVPYPVAWLAGAFSTGLARASFGRIPPSIPLDGVRMSQKRMWFTSARAERELGLTTRPAAEALERAARWFCEREGYVRERTRRAVLERLGASEERGEPRRSG